MTGMLRTTLVVACSLWLACTATAADARAEQVLRAQERLDALGLSPGPIDGLIGPRTRDALRAFQRQNDLPATGQLDWQTQIALSASVRIVGGDSEAPVPRSAPVPAVSISPLPAPEAPAPGPFGTEAGRDDLDTPGRSHGAAPAEAAAAMAGVSEPPAGPRPDTATAPAPPREEGGRLGRAMAAIVLGLAAAAAWGGLVLWWLRQRARRADPATVEE